MYQLAVPNLCGLASWVGGENGNQAEAYSQLGHRRHTHAVQLVWAAGQHIFRCAAWLTRVAGWHSCTCTQLDCKSSCTHIHMCISPSLARVNLCMCTGPLFTQIELNALCLCYLVALLHIDHGLGIPELHPSPNWWGRSSASHSHLALRPNYYKIL